MIALCSVHKLKIIAHLIKQFSRLPSTLACSGKALFDYIYSRLHSCKWGVAERSKWTYTRLPQQQMKDDRRFATVNCASYGHDARAISDKASTRAAMDAVTIRCFVTHWARGVHITGRAQTSRYIGPLGDPYR